jgi:hypothetical protein
MPLIPLKKEFIEESILYLLETKDIQPGWGGKFKLPDHSKFVDVARPDNPRLMVERAVPGEQTRPHIKMDELTVPDQTEVCMLMSKEEQVEFFVPRFTWTLFRRIKKLPRGIHTVGFVRRPVHIECHNRTIMADGGIAASYVTLFTIDYHRNIALPVSIERFRTTLADYSEAGIRREIDRINKLFSCFAAAISNPPDPSLWKLQIKESARCWFAHDEHCVKELCDLRDGPLVGNRRKAVLHWVADHLRRTPNGNYVDVQKHLRGISEFNIDGINFNITEPRKT